MALALGLSTLPAQVCLGQHGDSDEPGDRSHRNVFQSENPGLQAALESLRRLDPEQAGRLMRQLQRDAPEGQAMPRPDQLDPDLQRQIQELVKTLRPQDLPAGDSSGDSSGGSSGGTSGSSGRSTTGGGQGESPATGVGTGPGGTRGGVGGSGTGGSPTPDPGGAGPGGALSPDQRQAFNDRFRRLMESLQGRRDGAAGRGGDGGNQGRGPERNDRLRALIEENGDELRELFEGSMGWFKDGVEESRARGEDVFPWLDDPRFPETFQTPDLPPTIFDEMAKQFSGSEALDGMLRRGLRWRREREAGRQRRTRTQRGGANGEAGGSTNTPDNPGSGAGPRPRTDSMGSRLARRFTPSSRPGGLFGGRLPRLPRFFNFQGGISGMNVGAPRMSGLGFGAPSAPRVSKSALALVFALPFLVFGFGVLWNTLLRERVSAWVSAGRSAARRRGWPVPLARMRTPEELIENVVHAREAELATSTLDHRELGEAFRSRYPEESARLDALVSDFEKSYYARPDEAPGPDRIQSHVGVLRRLHGGEAS